MATALHLSIALLLLALLLPGGPLPAQETVPSTEVPSRPVSAAISLGPTDLSTGLLSVMAESQPPWVRELDLYLDLLSTRGTPGTSVFLAEMRLRAALRSALSTPSTTPGK